MRISLIWRPETWSRPRPALHPMPLSAPLTDRLQLSRRLPLAAPRPACYRPPVFRRSSAVEQLTVNQLVVGSIPTAGAKKQKGLTPPRQALCLFRPARQKKAPASGAFSVELLTENGLLGSFLWRVAFRRCLRLSVCAGHGRGAGHGLREGRSPVRLLPTLTLAGLRRGAAGGAWATAGLALGLRPGFRGVDQTALIPGSPGRSHRPRLVHPACLVRRGTRG